MGVDEYEGGPRAAILTRTAGSIARMDGALEMAFVLFESRGFATGALHGNHGHCIIVERDAGAEMP